MEFGIFSYFPSEHGSRCGDIDFKRLFWLIIVFYIRIRKNVWTMWIINIKWRSLARTKQFVRVMCSSADIVLHACS